MSDSSAQHRFSNADRLAIAAHAATAIATVLFTLSAILRTLEDGGRLPEGPPFAGPWPTPPSSPREPPNRAQSYFS